AQDERDSPDLSGDGSAATEVAAPELWEIDLHERYIAASRLLHALGEIKRELLRVRIISRLPLRRIPRHAQRRLFVGARRFVCPQRFRESRQHVRRQQRIGAYLFLDRAINSRGDFHRQERTCLPGRRTRTRARTAPRDAHDRRTVSLLPWRRDGLRKDRFW